MIKITGSSGGAMIVSCLQIIVAESALEQKTEVSFLSLPTWHRFTYTICRRLLPVVELRLTSKYQTINEMLTVSMFIYIITKEVCAIKTTDWNFSIIIMYIYKILVIAKVKNPRIQNLICI